MRSLKPASGFSTLENSVLPEHSCKCLTVPVPKIWLDDLNINISSLWKLSTYSYPSLFIKRLVCAEAFLFVLREFIFLRSLWWDVRGLTSPIAVHLCNFSWYTDWFLSGAPQDFTLPFSDGRIFPFCFNLRFSRELSALLKFMSSSGFSVCLFICLVFSLQLLCQITWLR